MSFNCQGIKARGVLKRVPLSFLSFALAVMVGLTSSFTFSAAFDMARSIFSSPPLTVAGVWQGELEDMPAVTIRLEQSGNELAGTARFTKLSATSEGLKVIGETAELPLKKMRFDGKKLLFEVSNEKEGTERIVAQMEMTFTDKGVAQLRRTGGRPEGTQESRAMVITMRRARSF